MHFEKLQVINVIYLKGGCFSVEMLIAFQYFTISDVGKIENRIYFTHFTFFIVHAAISSVCELLLSVNSLLRI